MCEAGLPHGRAGLQKGFSRAAGDYTGPEEDQMGNAGHEMGFSE